MNLDNLIKALKWKKYIFPLGIYTFYCYFNNQWYNVDGPIDWKDIPKDHQELIIKDQERLKETFLIMINDLY